MEIPSGMTENMMNIVRIEAARRRDGAKGYGDQVAKHDYSHLAVKRKTYEETAICRKCGNPFEIPPGTAYKVCDECKKKTRRDIMKKRWEEKKKNGYISNS